MWLSFGIRPAKNEHKRLLILKIQSPLVTAFGLSFFLSPKVGNSFQTAKHHSKNLHITSQKAFTTKLSSLSSMGGSPPFPRLRNSDTNTLLNPQQTKILPEKKNYLCRTQRQPLPSDTGELQKSHRSKLTDIRHLRWYFSYPPPVPQRGSTQRQALPSLNGVLLHIKVFYKHIL